MKKRRFTIVSHSDSLRKSDAVYYNKKSPKYRKAFRGLFFANSPILDYSFSRFLFTNSLKSLPFSKFFESNARS